MTISESVKKIVRRIFRITLITVGILISLVLLILVLIQTGPVQNYGRQKIEAFLEKKLQTKVRVGNLYIDFPTHIVLKNIYLEDRRKDTLLFGGKIAVDISMLRLLSNEIRINQLELDGVTLNLKRRLPDSVFNFQFVVDAFSSGKTEQPKKTDTSGGFQFIVGPVLLHNIHTTFIDDAGGNEMYFSLGDLKAKLKSFDPAHQSYDIPGIEIKNLSANIRQYKPLLVLQPAVVKTGTVEKEAEPLRLELGDLDLSGISLVYRDDVQNTDAVFRLRNVNAKADSMDLAKMHFKLKQISLDKTEASLRFGKTNPVKKNPGPKDSAAQNGNWSVDLTRLDIDSSLFRYDDDNLAAVKNGLDYNHLNLEHIQLKTAGVHADPANYRAIITGMSFTEKSGLVLKKLSGKIMYDAKGASLKDLVIQTNSSEIKTQASVKYRSLDDLKKRLGDMETNLYFDRSRIAVKDLLIFVPSLEEPLKDYRAAVFRLNGKVSGRLNNLRISDLELDGVGNTSLSADGAIRGLPDGHKAVYDLNISRFNTSKTDIYRFIPAHSIPENIRIPDKISASGKFRGTFTNFYVQLHTRTSEGNADISGMLNLDQKTYDLTASGHAVDLGYILKQDSLLGKITLTATAKGSGFEPKKMHSVFHINVGEARVRSYTYQGLTMDAQLENGRGKLESSIADPHVRYQLSAEADLREKYPAVKMNLRLDTMDMLALHLLNDSLQLHLHMDADFKSTDPDALQGTLKIGDLGWTLGSHAYHTDSASLVAIHSDTAQSIRLRSEAADLDWSGRYKIMQVPESFRQFINHYYQIPVSKPDSTEPENWRMALLVRPSPLVMAMMPA